MSQETIKFNQLYKKITTIFEKNNGTVKLLNNDSILNFTSYLLGFKNFNELIKSKENENILKFFHTLNYPKLATDIDFQKTVNQTSIFKKEKPSLIINNFDTNISFGNTIKPILKTQQPKFTNLNQLLVISDNFEPILNTIKSHLKNNNLKYLSIENNKDCNSIDFIYEIYSYELWEDLFFEEENQFSILFVNIIEQYLIPNNIYPDVHTLFQILNCKFLNQLTQQNNIPNFLKKLINKYLISLNINEISNNMDLESNKKHDANIHNIFNLLHFIQEQYELNIFSQNNSLLIENLNKNSYSIYCPNNKNLDIIFNFLLKKINNKNFNSLYLLTSINIDIHHMKNLNLISFSNELNESYNYYTNILFHNLKSIELPLSFYPDFYINTENTQNIFNNNLSLLNESEKTAFILEKNDNITTNLKKYELYKIDINT